MIISVSAFLLFLFFWLFLFMPAHKQVAALKNELILADQQIQSIELLLAGAQSQDQVVRLLKEKQRYLSNKFPQKEEEGLRLIPELARKMDIDIISLLPGTRTELLDASNKQIAIENRAVSYLPVTLELSCYFKDLVKYAIELRTTFPAFTSINSLDIKREGQTSGKIRANIKFNLYLLN